MLQLAPSLGILCTGIVNSTPVILILPAVIIIAIASQVSVQVYWRSPLIVNVAVPSTYYDFCMMLALTCGYTVSLHPSYN